MIVPLSKGLKLPLIRKLIASISILQGKSKWSRFLKNLNPFTKTVKGRLMINFPIFGIQTKTMWLLRITIIDGSNFLAYKVKITFRESRLSINLNNLTISDKWAYPNTLAKSWKAKFSKKVKFKNQILAVRDAVKRHLELE